MTKRTRLTPLQKVLMGKGIYQRTKPIQGPPGGIAGLLFGQSKSRKRGKAQA